MARSLWLPVISIRARVANPVAKENSAELLTTKGEPPTRSTVQLKIEIGLEGRKPSSVILSPLGLIAHPPHVLLSRHILEISQFLENIGDRGPACGRNLPFSPLLHLTILLRDLRLEVLENLRESFRPWRHNFRSK